jgi:2-polyprenyl-3-methyl-5-hydroxy-6-metoxy-1,4-benzoquinol methylase
MIEKLDKIDINNIEYWDEFYDKGLTEKIEKKRLYFYEDLKCFLKKGSYTLLEIGCGTGYGLNYLLKFFPEYKMTGFDISSIAIKKASEINNKIFFSVFDVLKQPVNENYDYMLIIQTLEHFSCPFEIIDKCIEHCKFLIVSVPYKHAMSNDEAHITTNFTEECFDKYSIIDHKVIKYGGKKSRAVLYVAMKGKLKF